MNLVKDYVRAIELDVMAGVVDGDEPYRRTERHPVCLASVPHVVEAGLTGPRLPALRDGDRFATGLEYGVTLAFVRWVLPLEPDDFAPAGVVIQSNPGSE